MWGDKEAFRLASSLEPTPEPTPSWQAEKICPTVWDSHNPPRFSQKAAPFGHKPPGFDQKAPPFTDDCYALSDTDTSMLQCKL